MHAIQTYKFTDTYRSKDDTFTIDAKTITEKEKFNNELK